MKTKYCLLALLWPVGNLFAQTSLSGVVHTKTNSPLANVTVSLPGSGTRTITNASGVFLLVLRQPADTLIVSSTGYRLYKIPVTPQSGFSDITLEEHTEQLDEVVVIGYGITTKRTNTGSVTTVAGADIAKQPVMNPLAALEGRVPGLNVTQSNGVPGSSFAVQVRGQGSLAQGSSPLFVIDGVPYAPNNAFVNNLSSAVSGSGNSGLSPFSSLNPADIESITVLKDADATAIYGSRGANGVILITTKKGKYGATTFQLNTWTGGSQVAKPVELMKTPDYLRMRREAFANDGTAPDESTAPDLLLWDTSRYTDFQQLLTGGTAQSQDVQASFSGGNANTQFLAGGSYHRETTVFPGDLADKRGSLHVSLNHQSANKKLSIVFSLLYSSERNLIPITDLSGQARFLPPNAPPLRDSAGALQWSENGVSFGNPLGYLLQTYRAVTANGLANLILSYRVLPQLTLRVSAGYNTYDLREVNANPTTSQDPQYNPQGNSQFGMTDLQSRIIEPQVDYVLTRGQLRLSALIGGTVQENTNSSQSLYAYGYPNDQLLESPGGAGGISVLAANRSDYRYAAAFGRVSASWASRYLLNLSGRRDGSSRFGPGRQWANFGAAGAGWIFSEEKWVKKAVPFLSFGKLRGSYGVTGNDQIGDYNYLNTWSPTQNPYNGTGGLYPTQLFNPQYSWETNRKWEGGLELSFLKERFALTTDYYRNRSSNQLVQTPLPTQTGFNSVLGNLPAVVENTGWELSLSTKNIAHGAFAWSTTLALTLPRNRLISFPGLSTSSYRSSYELGKPLSIVKGYTYTGVDAETGAFTYQDINKDGVLDDQDMHTIADLTPRCYGGMGNNLTWKGWQLDLFVQFRQGTGVSYLYPIYTPYGSPPGGMLNQPAAVLARWQKAGDVTGTEQYTATPGTAAYTAAVKFSSSSAAYTDASFARLKTVAFSYTIPTRWLGKTGISLLRIYAQGQNLLTLTQYAVSDPETQDINVLPPLRTITAGLQITF